MLCDRQTMLHPINLSPCSLYRRKRHISCEDNFPQLFCLFNTSLYIRSKNTRKYTRLLLPHSLDYLRKTIIYWKWNLIFLYSPAKKKQGKTSQYYGCRGTYRILPKAESYMGFQTSYPYRIVLFRNIDVYIRHFLEYCVFL